MALPAPAPEHLVSAALAEHAGELRGFVGARVPAAEVDDILQTAALRAVERAASLDDPTRVRAWLFTIHRHLVVDTLRRNARQDRLRDALQQHPGDDSAVSPAAETCDCSVVQARKLRPAYADILGLVDAGGASLPEAAEQLGISRNNAAVRLHRARKALRRAMHDHCGVESAGDCRECACVYAGCCEA